MDSLTFWEAYTTLGINYTSASNIVTTVEYIFNSGDWMMMTGIDGLNLGKIHFMLESWAV